MDYIYKVIKKYYSLFVEYSVIRPLINSVDSCSHILEIGGGYNPRFKKDIYNKAYHLDHCDTESLKNKYRHDSNVSHLVEQIQTVDFVADGSPLESLLPPGLTFDYIYSAHAIEHQVDFVGHLRSLGKMLRSQGRIILVIPDLRACFDRFRFPTVTADVLAAYMKHQAVHQGKQVFEALAQGLDINPGRFITRRELDGADFFHPLESAYEAMCHVEGGGTVYHDLHAWTFTPVSFRLLLVELFLLDLISLKVVTLTGLYGNQFCAVLENASQDEKTVLKQSYRIERLKLTRRLHRIVTG